MPVFCNNCGCPNNDKARFCSQCGNAVVKPVSGVTLNKGVILDGRYEIVELIKSGGMGSVYKAIDNRLDEVCAVKEMTCQYTSAEEQQYAVSRFNHEAKTLAKLRHLNLPRVIDHFTIQGKYYLVMDLIPGEDLEMILKREDGKGLPESKVIDYAIQVLDVLSYLHSQNPPIVYRDLKPPNIMIQNIDGKVMLVDFGIARAVQPGSMTKKTSVGTEGYIAPEQYIGKPEPKSDLYSLGATMHHLLTGVEPMLPFHFTSVRQIDPKISEKTNDIVMKALQMKPEERFSSAEEMKKALEIPCIQSVEISTPSRISVISREPLYRTLPSKEEKPAREPEPVYRTLPSKKQEAPEGMVLIPEGEFILGSEISDTSCRPQQKLFLPAFYIDKYTVSNLMYRKFVRETGHKVPFMEGKEFKEYNWDTRTRNYPSGKANYPVVLVSWYDAYAYAKWANKRLPTEVEWEKAARGTDGRMYPWGNNWEVGKANCIMGGIGSTSPREMFPYDRSVYDVMEMAGNVRQCTGDFYYPYPYKGPYKKGKMVSLRGGAWSDNPNFLACYLRNRNLPHYKYNNIGFRCVMDIEDT